MTTNSTERLLAQQGLLIFLVGLLMGAFTQTVANPRMMMGAHTGALLTGTFLVALSSAWKHLNMTDRNARLTLWMLIGGSWGVSVALVFAAVFATSRSTPIMGAGHSGTPWAEAVSDVSLSVSSIAVLLAAVNVVRAVYAKPSAST